MCSIVKVFLEILQNSQENTCEFCEISKNTFFHRTPPVAASELRITYESCSGSHASGPSTNLFFSFKLT